jgi:putative flippase GtrA
VPYRTRIREFVRFLLVGGTSTLLYFGVYAGLVTAGVRYALAASAAFAVSVLTGFLLHDRWTFKTKSASAHGLAKWLALQLTVFGLNLLALTGLVHGAHLHRVLAQLVLLPMIPLTTYFVGRRFVFVSRSPTAVVGP